MAIKTISPNYASLKSTVNRVGQFLRRTAAWLGKHGWVIPLIVLILAYGRLPFTYFEQDEWQAFETYEVHQHQSIATCVTVQRPLTCVVNTIEWHLFGTHASAYAVTSILFALAISLLLYRYMRRWPIPPYKAVLIASVFPLFAAGSQAITWFGAFSASLPTFFFALLALDCLVESIQRPSWRWSVATVVSVAISLYFKEESLWVFPVMLAVWYAATVSAKQQLSFKKLLLSVGWSALFGVVFLLIERSRQLHGTSFTGLVSSSDPSHYASDVLHSLVLLPIDHLAHIIFPPEVMGSLTAGLAMNTTQLSRIVTGVLLLCFAGFLAVRPAKERPILLVLVVWALTAFVAYAIFGKNPDFLEGRYYLAAQAPVVALLILGLLPNEIKSIQSLNTIGTGIFIFIALINLTTLQQRLTNDVKIGQERRHILDYITRQTGPLPARAIIYTQSSNYGYVGQAAYLMPFQNGLATTLRVLYQGHNQDYSKLAPKQLYLWNLLAQGYDEVDGVGFGYFREYEKLRQAVRDNKLPVDSVYAFRYQGKSIDNITSLIRGRLLLENQSVMPLSHDGWKISSSNDAGVDAEHGIDKLLDADLKSDWSVPHRYGQYLQVDLGKTVDNVVGVNLTTADGNSYPKVYHFSYSVDGEHWVDDFTDGGELDSNAVTPIRFGAKTLRALRITIYDTRPTVFSWSVSNVDVMVTPSK